MRRGVFFMGTGNVDIVRASFQPTLPLVNGDLQQQQIDDIAYRLYLIGLSGANTPVTLNTLNVSSPRFGIPSSEPAGRFGVFAGDVADSWSASLSSTK